jgi:hypothetical protein
MVALTHSKSQLLPGEWSKTPPKAEIVSSNLAGSAINPLIFNESRSAVSRRDEMAGVVTIFESDGGVKLRPDRVVRPNSCSDP